MLNRSTRLTVARAVLALMLFAQGAMALADCDLLEPSPARAVLASAEVAPCHESGFGAVCLTHCLSDREVVQKVGMDIPTLPPSPVLSVALVLAALPRMEGPHAAIRAPGTSPPRRILLQSFQI